MADFNVSKALNTAGGLGALAGSWAGAYLGGPKAASNEGHMKKASIVGGWRYGASDMSGLMSQWKNTPVLENVTYKDFFNPSSGEMFGHMFGSGMAAYGAASGLTKGLEGKLGTTQLGGSGGSNINAPVQQDPSTSEMIADAGSREEQFDIAEQSATNPLEAGVYKDMSVAAANSPAKAPQQTSTMSSGNPTTNQGSLLALQQTNPWEVGYQGFGCGGHMHGCGGHKFAGGGGISLDWGKGVGTALNLASGAIGVGLAYAGMKAQREKAKMEAKEVNAMNLYARQLQQHNFDEAVTDSKNNMFNQQALQMMALGGDLYAMGGDLQTHGADYPLLGNYNIIGAGGTHEQNPLGGVFQGMAADGKPNLVEEDEVVWNDYVFSNRLTIPKDFAKERKLKEGLTYAQAAQKLAVEAEERPNDPISQNGMAEALGALQVSQEELKQKQEATRVKRAIAKMSPEEVMNMVAMLQGSQQQAQPMEQQMPMEQPTMQQPMFAEGGYLGAYHELKEGTPGETKTAAKKMSRSERRAAEKAAAQDKGLMENLLGNIPTEVLRDIASQLPGYNADNFNNTNANSTLRQFIMDQYGKSTTSGKTINMENLNNYIAGKRVLGAIDPNSIDYTRTRQVTYDNSAYNANKVARDAYSHSRTQKNLGTYKYEGTKGDANVTALEASPEYIKQTDYILEQLDRMKNGQDYNHEFLESYFSDIDNNIPIAKGSAHATPKAGSTVKGYFQRDAQGNILRDANGRALYADDIYGTKGADGHWTGGRYYDMRNDHKRGMVHQPFELPTEVVHNPGERTLYRVKGADGNFTVVSQEDVENNPYFRRLAQSGEDTVTTDENGDQLTTHYVDFESPEYQAEYTPEEPQPEPVPLPTWPRYAPLLSGLGMLQGPAKDYSTAVSPRVAHYEPIGDYLPYLPVDTQRYINAENQQAAAQLNAIMNASAGNRNMAMAQAALANSQRQQGIGQRMQAAEALNWDRRRQAGEFNRGTNMFNAQAHNAAEIANLQVNPLLLKQEQQNQLMRYQADRDRDAAISASANAFLDSLGEIGRENFYFNQANSNEALRFGVDANPFFGGISSYKKPTIGKTVTMSVGNPSAADEEAVAAALGGYLLSKPKKNRR